MQMDPNRRLVLERGLKSIGSLGVLVVLLTESELVGANTSAKLIGVRIWPSDDYTRICLLYTSPSPRD